MAGNKVAETREIMANAKRIVAFTGAGISTESGLSDFRSPGGLWTKYRVVTHQEFVSSVEARKEYWDMRSELIPMILSVEPNEGHKVLAEMEAAGRLSAVITQNIDGLHQVAGSRNVIELHGTNRTASCLSCKRRWRIEIIQGRLEGGDRNLRCDVCGGLIDPDTVSFGQSMPVEAMSRAHEEVSRCDLMFMIGSSLEVYPAASFPGLAHQNGAKLIFVNRADTPFDDIADLIERGPIGPFMRSVWGVVAI